MGISLFPFSFLFYTIINGDFEVKTPSPYILHPCHADTAISP
jgi:hypothetical protein